MIIRERFDKMNLLVGGCFAVVGTWLLAAMLGQIDNLLGGWYSNPANKWEFPFPLIFNKTIPALEAWELMYALMAISFALIFFAGFFLGKQKTR
jgi:hypothetical protein